MAVTSDTLDFTFLDAVNRVLRQNSIIKGDDDALTSFTGTQHAATVEIAKIAIQDELIELTSDKVIPLEKVEGTLTTSSGARVYNLATDFVQFWSKPLFYNSTDNRQLYEYPGGEESLRIGVFDYKTQSGDPNWWYFEEGARKKVGFYQVPNSSKTYTYDYERSILVEAVGDEIPLHNKDEAFSFSAMAGRRFKFLYENARNVEAILSQDPFYQSARGRLIRLIRGQDPEPGYGFSYIS